MRNLLQLILRYSNFLVFLLLEVAAVVLVVVNNDYPHFKVLSSANYAAGVLRDDAHRVGNYFRLSKQNELLAQENAALREQVLNAGIVPSSSQSDAYTVIAAEVIDRTLHREHNYLTLNKGRADGIAAGMGVVSKDGAVGIVRTVSEHYSIVVPLIHDGWKLSVVLPAHDCYEAFIHWQCGDYHTARLEDVAGHVPLNDGDSVMTSGLSAIFPRNVPVGVVESVHLGEGESYYKARIKLATDYKDLYHVEVLNYVHRNELDSLIEAQQ